MENIKELVDYAAHTYRDRPAVRYLVDGKVETKTFLDLKKDSCSMSNAIHALGQSNLHIAIMGSTGYLWWVSFLGIVNSANVAVPIDINLSSDEVISELIFADVSMFMYDKTYEELAQEIKKRCRQIKYFVELSENTVPMELSLANLLQDKREISYPINNDSCCMIMFTSGTSGRSKGVMLTPRGLAVNAQICSAQTGWTGEDTSYLAVLPIYHIYCLSVNFLWALCLGVCLNINDDLVNIIANTHLFKVNTIIMVPMILEFLNSQLRLMAKRNLNLSKRESAEKLLGKDITNFVVGGALVKAELKAEIAEYGIEINEGYGMTESSCNIAETYRHEPRVGSVGKVVAGLEGKIVEGELWVKGQTVMLGYYKDKQKTAETIEDGWLKTGDLGYFDEEGYLYLTGRKNILIVLSNGENISPEQLENQIKEAKIVKEVMVYQIEDKIMAEIFPDSIYVIAHEITNISLELEHIIQDINRRNPMYKHIHEVIIRDVEFEKTTSRKIKRKRIKQRC